MSRSETNRLLLAGIGAAVGCDDRPFRRAVERVADWERTAAVADRAGIAPLLGEAIRRCGAADRLPDAVRDGLQRSGHVTGIRNAALQDELLRLLDAFECAGIETILLKGAAFAETLWHNLALRPMADLDLLIRDTDCDRAAALLDDLGYRPCRVSRPAEWYASSHHHLTPLIHEPSGTVVELHRNLARPGPTVSPDAAPLWERSRTAMVGGRSARVLSPEDAALHLCLHIACDDPFTGKARSVADLAALLHQAGESFDWPVLTEEARRIGAMPLLYHPLRLVAKLDKSLVPDEILAEALRRSRPRGAQAALLRRFVDMSLFNGEDGGGLLPQWRIQGCCEALLFRPTTLQRLSGVFGALAGSAPEEPVPDEPPARFEPSDLLRAPGRLFGRMRPPRDETVVPDDEHVIEVRDLVKRYPEARRYRQMLLYPFRRSEVTALDGVSLDVRRGEIFGLLGPNGAGKTTLIRTLSTLVLPTSGTVRVEGYDVTTHGRAVRRRIGYAVSDERSFYWRLTGRQNLRFFATLNNLGKRDGDARIREVAELMGITESLDRRFRSYSTGMRQRLAIARGLLTLPEVILLDEPTRALDPVAARDLRRFIKETLAGGGRTVLLATHNLEEAERLCDRVAILHRGTIRACDGPVALRRKHGEPARHWLRARAPVHAVRNAFDELQLPHRILSVEPDSCGNVTIVKFEADGDGEAAPEIVRAVVTAGLPVESFGPEASSLEDVFARLVE